MSLQIEALPGFLREVKQLQKRHPSVRDDLEKLLAELAKNPTQGTALGNNCYKIRLAIKSKGQGKSGGARVITMVTLLAERLMLLSIYDKSEQETISADRLATLAREAGL